MPGDQPRVLHFVVSLNQYIAPEQMEELICETASAEDPGDTTCSESSFTIN